MSTSRRQRIVIAGAGVAALEGLIALRDLAGDDPEILLVTPEREFVYRPMAVVEPFSFAAAHRYPLARIAADHDAELRHGSLGWVESRNRTATTVDGEALHYDALLLATGATKHDCYRRALTIDDRRIDESLHGLIQDIELGYTSRVAFLMPPRVGWPLPLYEFALLTAQRSKEMCVDVELTIVSPEDAPLAIFGASASSEVSKVLAEAGIRFISCAHADVPEARRVTIKPGDLSLEVDRIVALPQLFGPAIRGIPLGASGFIPTAPYGEVRGVAGAYAAGDAIDFPVKHGGLAAQQADAAATSIAAQLGFSAPAAKFEPELRGMLLTGERPLYITAKLIGGAGFASKVSRECPWSPPSKISARYLSPYLEQLDRAEFQAATA